MMTQFIILIKINCSTWFIERLIIMSVKVAIRVRPFNERQKFLGCIGCIQMKQNTTVLYQNKQKNKKQHYFTFDYSFWSHDQFTLRHDGYMMPTTSKYIDQQRIYNVIGREILQNAWNGYNCCLFAYGQTGAGKSYSMIGYGANRGIIPMVCEEIFQKIKKFERKGEKEYEITLSMLQIYNQKVQDLFVPTSKRPPTGLKIRENKTLGVYVEGLTKHQVFSYIDIQKRMDEGSKNKSLASTLMNEYSSRAHTIVMLEFVQKEWINRLKMNKKSSFINLVDLAGSERVSKTGISDNKDRLKQASNINKSLHTLGRVIEVLADQAAGKSKIAQVPYRDSALTRILQTALGGNSKTTMICAISPANDNYEETLSTLRYADQTKKIKNKPIVNQSAVDKIIRQLREENDRLKKMLETPQEKDLSNSRELAPSEKEKKELRSNLRASMREVQKEIRKNLKSFAINTEQLQEEEESLMMTQFVDLQEPSQMFSQLSFDLGNKAQVYITNLNQDEQLNYKVRYSCEKDLLITNKNSKKAARGMESFAKIVLCGLGIEENHAKIVQKGDRYFIEALSETSAQYTLLNGKPVYERKELQHNDRIILGINSVFLFKDNNKKSESKGNGIDYEFVINERQKEMENSSLIPPSSLSLFLPTNFIRDNRTKDIYAGPPTQALNATKKLFGQENQTEILEKISQIETQFDKMVKQNEEKLKEKQQFYRNKLTELKKEKEKEKEQKSKIEQKLMIKSIQSETLKSKNSQLENLKKKLSKYVDQKNRRAKLRESMLLDTDDNRNNAIEEDIIGQFVDLQDPNQKNIQKIGMDFGGGVNMDNRKKKDKSKKIAEEYQEVKVQQFQDNQDIFKTVINPMQGTDSLLLADSWNFQPQSTNKERKTEKITKKEVLKQRQAISDSFLENQQKQLKVFQFRRLYNIKILSQILQDILCSNCQSNLPQLKPQEINDSFALKYVAPRNFSDAELEELHFKNTNKKEKKAKITQDDLLLLQQHIQALQNKLLEKDQKQRLSVGSQKHQDSLLLNYSVQHSVAQNSDQFKKDQKRHKESFSIRNYSKDEEINFTLSQEPQSTKMKTVDLKIEVSQFIQVLSKMPYLNIVKQDQLTVTPNPKRMIALKMEKSHQESYSYHRLNKILEIEQNEDLYFMFVPLQTKPISLLGQENDDVLLHSETQIIKQQQCAIAVNIEKNDFGVNTEVLLDEQEINDKAKGTSFTAFLNQQFQQINQNHTQQYNTLEKEKTSKQYAQAAINTSLDLQNGDLKQMNQLGVQTDLQINQAEMVTDINMHTYVDVEAQNVEQVQQEHKKEEHLEEQHQIQCQNQVQSQIQNYLLNKKDYEDKSINTEDIKQMEKIDFQINTEVPINNQISLNTSIVSLQLEKQVVNLTITLQKQQKQSYNVEQDELEQYIAQRQEENQIEKYLQKEGKKSEQVAVNTQRQLLIVNQEFQLQIRQVQESPINSLKQIETERKVISQFKLVQLQKLSFESQNLQVVFIPQQKQKLVQSIVIKQNIESAQRNRPQMIDQQIQVDQKIANGSLVDESLDENKKNEHSSNANERLKHREKAKQLGNSQELHDKFNLSVSDIQKHEISYQQLSVFGFDGLLKEDQLNSKIKLLQQKIKELESQSTLKQVQNKPQEKQPPKEEKLPSNQIVKQQNEQNIQLKRQLDLITKKGEQTDLKVSKYVPIKRNKKKKKKSQLTQEEKRQHEIEKQLQAKIIQCNNQNIINQRNLQIHKRKREAEELRKILVKKQKVQLQKQLLVLIPMVRRFNLIAREMKRLIQGKISVEYRNFSHYEMVQILKSYSVNKKAHRENIQIRIVVLNCEEGRIYTWPVDVFKNRYQISEQTFEKYLQTDDDRDGRNRMLEDRSEKSKDPFWDPVDFIPQGIGYLSILSYEGYISIVYKSSIIAKLFVSLTPVKVKKQLDEQAQQLDNEEESQLQHIEIYNQRNLLEKQIYFTISIESIKFMKNEERPKLDEINNIIDLNSLNSNILKYTISYELLQNDYKLVNFTTPEIDFVQDKQFKRVDYMRRHCFKNISEATLAYISDCPVKFSLNVMKDYNQECLNASFTQDLNSQSDQNQLDSSHNSGFSDTKSIRSKKSSVSEKDVPNQLVQPGKSDFSKKPNIIYENTQIVAKLESEAKKQQERRNATKKLQQNKAKIAKYEKDRQREKDKDKEKDCAIY